MQTASNPFPFKPNTLAQKIQTQSQYALNCGALLPIPTLYEWVQDEGLVFLVRVVDNLKRKAKASKKQKKSQNEADFNPFLPYDPNLFVADISETHLVLLNKFNVMDHHFLIITRKFEAQETWLNLQDFEALWQCLFEVDGLGFYNGGTLAGSSQRHKHLQVVPTPLAPEGPMIPIEPWINTWIEANIATETAYRCPQFPFDHAIAHWSPFSSASQAAQNTYQRYLQILETLGLGHPTNAPQPLAAYNLLATRRWMMIVPRSQEKFANISINSLGFSGTMLVRDAARLKQLKQIGPMTLLKSVGIPFPSPQE